VVIGHLFSSQFCHSSTTPRTTATRAPDDHCGMWTDGPRNWTGRHDGVIQTDLLPENAWLRSSLRVKTLYWTWVSVYTQRKGNDVVTGRLEETRWADIYNRQTDRLTVMNDFNIHSIASCRRSRSTARPDRTGVCVHIGSDRRVPDEVFIRQRTNKA